jgi:serine/threonine-protein kinase
MGVADQVPERAELSRFAPGEIIASKYRVERVVGSGGMGVVVEAQHLQLGQSVAIKLLAVQQEHRTEAIARFLREGRAAAALRSDHVVRIYDVGTHDDGSPFIVMEFLRGCDLATLLEHVGPLAVDEAVEYVVQAAMAISEAHDNGIVHRDLKPSNLFITERTDGTALIKVLDFGISKSVRSEGTVDGNLTATRSVMGSPYYMSPEQVRDAKSVDGRTDIWALGVILQELLTAEPVFQGDTLPGICAAIAADPPAPLRARRPDVSHELQAVVLRCLEKNANRRYQTVRELLTALGPFRRRAPQSVRSHLDLVLDRGSGPVVSPSAPTLVAEGEGASFRPSFDYLAASTPQRHAVVEERTELSARTSAPVVTPKKHRLALILGGAGLALALLAGAYAGLSLREPTPGATESVAAPTVFRLQIESTPAAAEVYEGQLRIGQTPLQIWMDRKQVAGKPRRFVLRLPGYEPYEVVQGDSQDNVRVLATLVRSPEPKTESEPESREDASPKAESELPEAADKPAVAPKVRPRPRPAKPRQPAPSAAPSSTESDIRMQR